MKKYFLLSALFIFVALSLSGQRLDEQKHSYSFLQLPRTPLQGQFESYSVRIHAGDLNLASMGVLKSQMAESFFQLENYELKSAEGDFEILVTFDGDFLASKEIKSKKTTEGKGESAKTVTTYFYEVKYRIPITYQISDGKRIVMVEKIYSSYDRLFTKNFGNERSSKSLLAKWENSGATSLNKWVKDDFNTLLNSLGNHFRGQFDTRMTTRQVSFYSVKKAEKIGYEDFASNMSGVGAIVSSASAEKVLTLADFGGLIDEWKAVLQSADPEDKKEGVVFQAAAYNLAMANVMAGNYGDAATFSTKLDEPDKRAYLKRAADSFIEELKNRYKANQGVEYTYHPTFDSESAALNTVVETQTETPTPVIDDIHEGHVVTLSGRDTIAGILHYDYETRGGRDSDLYSLKGIRVENLANTPPSRYFKIEEVANTEDNGELMIPVEMAVGPIGVITMQHIIHTVNGLMLTLNTYDGDHTYCMLRLVLNKKGEKRRKVYIMDGGLAFIKINKGLANKFEDCPTILAKALADEYEKTESSYLQVLEDYDGCAPDFD